MERKGKKSTAEEVWADEWELCEIKECVRRRQQVFSSSPSMDGDALRARSSRGLESKRQSGRTRRRESLTLSTLTPTLKERRRFDFPGCNLIQAAPLPALFHTMPNAILASLHRSRKLFSIE